MSARIELLCLGTELLSGQLNTHQRYLALALRRVGLSLSRESSLPDDAAAIAAEVRASLRRCDALLVCGGLGPTFDDVTREAVADALNRPLVYKPRLFTAIKRKLARHRIAIPENNRKQAYVIKGAQALENTTGSAPGQLLRLARKSRAPQTIALLPGPFAELSPMFEQDVLPKLQRGYAQGLSVEHLTIHLFGLPESAADEKLRPVIAEAGPRARFTILAGGGQVDFHVTTLATTRAQARRGMKLLRQRIYEAVGSHVFGEGKETLESAAGNALRARKLTLAVAESCTGGLLGERLTAVAGSSDYFKGGVIAYADEVKVAALGVSPALIKNKGAVSAECARAMAQGARRAAGCDIGLSITGIAGPGGGTKDKPVGLVYIGLAGPGLSAAHRELKLSGRRETVRRRAAASALHYLLSHLEIHTMSK